MKKYLTLIVVVIAIILASSIYYFYYRSNNIHTLISSSPPVTNVELVELKEINSPELYTTYGSLVAPNSVDLKSQVTGVIQSINFSNGQLIKKGELLLTIDDADALSSLETAQAQLDQLTADYQRYKTLYKDAQAVSKEQLDKFKAQYQTALANFQSAQANYQHTKVKAPFDGKTGVAEVAIGSYVESGTQLVKIVDRKDLEVEYALPETFIGKVKINQTVTITTDAYPNRIFKASVNYISPDVNTDSLTFNVRAQYNNIDDLLSPGMNVDVTHILNPKTKVILVPMSALSLINKGYSVFEVIDGKAKAIPIDVGLISSNGDYIIKSGIKAGSKIIKNANGITEGMDVKVTQ
ncbi:efflux RND transporter periplasmic adaptor subunit [Thiotrichales bacterium 19S3-7]|nr:efflux RND transporter periplasmic adaptor subunit [Thiotrichales bacterium 19S3-7]MCF6802529.1 efflux RND transporter periplasmic adaptor subunit [Thiotrichales bacterium 19S3-11]